MIITSLETSGRGQYTEKAPFFRSSVLPFFRSSVLPFFRSSVLPFFRSSVLPLGIYRRNCTVFLFPLMLALSACFSPWTGDGGVLTLYMGSGPSQALGIGYNEGGNRGPDPADIGNLDFDIHLSRPGVSRIESRRGAGPHQLPLASGDWTVRVEAFYQGILYAESDPQTVNIGSGGTSVSISLGPAGKAWNEEDFGPGALVEYRYFSAADAALSPTDPDSLSAYLNNLGGRSNKNCVVTVEGTHTVVPAGTSVLQVGPTANNLKVSFRGSGTIALDSGSTGTIVHLTTSTSGNKFILRGPTLKGHDSNTGPVVNISLGDMDMNGGAIIDNAYSGNGSGVCFSGTNFKMTGGTISGNRSTITTSGYNGGGGVYFAGTTFEMSKNAKIRGNTTTGAGAGTGSGGGGVLFNGTTFIMSGNAEISGNTITNGNGGGGVYVVGGTFTMSDKAAISGGSLTSNAAAGGGVYVGGTAAFTMSGSASIKNNAATGSGTSNGGGGVYVASSSATAFTMSDSAEISGNKAHASPGKGGGVFVSDGTFTMTGGAISRNSSEAGGGVFVNGSGNFIMPTGSTAVISGNEATDGMSNGGGGGVYVNNGGTFTMRDGTIGGSLAADKNTSVTQGGGVRVSATNPGTTNFTMYDGGTIRGNSATGDGGGGIFIYGAGGTAEFTMHGGIINANSTAGTYGGGVYATGTNGVVFTMNGGTITGNRATGASSKGGGVFLSGNASGFATFGAAGPGSISGNTANNAASTEFYYSGSGAIALPGIGNLSPGDGCNTPITW